MRPIGITNRISCPLGASEILADPFPRGADYRASAARPPESRGKLHYSCGEFDASKKGLTVKQARVVGVVLAGGSGTRVGLSIPKQLLKIAGKTVMEHTIAVFQDTPVIDEVFVLMHPDHIAAAEEIASRYPKVTKVLAGGNTRNDTTNAALTAFDGFPGDTKILFHDAVRPFVDNRILSDMVNALDRYDAVDVAIPSADTIIEVDEAGSIAEIPDRSRLRRGQTPQAFRLDTIKEAYRLGWQDPNFVATDDCTVVLRYLPEVEITVVDGAESNMKITDPIDVFIADKLFQIGMTVAPSVSDPREYIQLLNDKVIVVLGGSYGIGADIVKIASSFGARAFSFSRSQTGTHVERSEDIEAALKQVHDECGRIDYVVVSAGILNRGELADTSLDDIVAGINVNYLAPVLAARASLPYLKETKGQLLFFTSSSYTRGRASYSLYSSSKAAVVNLTQALADEWSSVGVRVNCINPERTATPMRSKAFGEEPKDSLLSSRVVALTSLDVLLSDLTGSTIDVRRVDTSAGVSRSENEVNRIIEALNAAESDLGALD